MLTVTTFFNIPTDFFILFFVLLTTSPEISYSTVARFGASQYKLNKYFGAQLLLKHVHA